MQRKKLDLKPRSVTNLSEEPTTPTTPGGTKKKADPFGGAKPVDVSEVERKVEEKLRQKSAPKVGSEKADSVNGDEKRAKSEKATSEKATSEKGDETHGVEKLNLKE